MVTREEVRKAMNFSRFFKKSLMAAIFPDVNQLDVLGSVTVEPNECAVSNWIAMALSRECEFGRVGTETDV